MKWILPGPIHDDSFAENVACALQDIGHIVITRPHQPHWWLFSSVRRYGRVITTRLPRIRSKTAVDRWLIRAIREHRPDALLATTVSVHESILREARQLGVRFLIAWWGDTPANLTQMELLSPEWDMVYLKDRMAVNKFRIAGLHADLLHEAMNPHWHKPVSQQQHGQVTIVGNYYGYRQAVIRCLTNRGVSLKLYGSTPPYWSDPLIPKLHCGQFVTKEEKSRVFGEGLACLNTNALSEFDSLNCRAFEIAGAGGLQLIEHKPCISECFEPDREILPYSTLDQLLEYVERAKRDEPWTRIIRNAGAARAVAEHTYHHRIARIRSDLKLPA